MKRAARERFAAELAAFLKEVLLTPEADMRRRRRVEVVDKMAATYILQGALDSLGSA